MGLADTTLRNWLHGDTRQPKNASTTALAGALSSVGRTYRKREAGDEFILSGQVELLALASGGNANASGKHDHEPSRLWGYAKNCRRLRAARRRGRPRE